jgi:hypothetical protein
MTTTKYYNERENLWNELPALNYWLPVKMLALWLNFLCGMLHCYNTCTILKLIHYHFVSYSNTAPAFHTFCTLLCNLEDTDPTLFLKKSREMVAKYLKFVVQFIQYSWFWSADIPVTQPHKIRTLQGDFVGPQYSLHNLTAWDLHFLQCQTLWWHLPAPY